MKTQRPHSATLLALLLGCVFAACSPPADIDGGPCKYIDHPGTATITRIEKTEASRQQSGITGYEGLEVHFTFKPDVPLKDGLGAKAATREHSLTISSGTYPGPEYLKKYKLEVGKTFRATMSVITSGTCTPVIVKLEGVDSYDSFEGRK